MPIHIKKVMVHPYTHDQKFYVIYTEHKLRSTYHTYNQVYLNIYFNKYNILAELGTQRFLSFATTKTRQFNIASGTRKKSKNS